MFYRIMFFFMALLTTSPSFAHTGHDHSSFLSGLLHFLWALPVILSVAAIVFYLKSVLLKNECNK